jgi:hypothetical protein
VNIATSRTAVTTKCLASIFISLGLLPIQMQRGANIGFNAWGA